MLIFLNLFFCLTFWNVLHFRMLKLHMLQQRSFSTIWFFTFFNRTYIFALDFARTSSVALLFLVARIFFVFLQWCDGICKLVFLLNSRLELSVQNIVSKEELVYFLEEKVNGSLRVSLEIWNINRSVGGQLSRVPSWIAFELVLHRGNDLVSVFVFRFVFHFVLIVFWIKNYKNFYIVWLI